MRFYKALAASLLLHSLFVYMLLNVAPKKHGGEGDQKEQSEKKDGTGQDKKEGANFIKPGDDKDHPLEITLVEKSDVPIDAENKKEKEKGHSCSLENSYEGIGIQQDGYGAVTTCPEFDPAYKAGLRVGDIIISPNAGEIRGPKGSVLHIIFVRNGQTLELDVVRDRICMGDT